MGVFSFFQKNKKKLAFGGNILACSRHYITGGKKVFAEILYGVSGVSFYACNYHSNHLKLPNSEIPKDILAPNLASH